MTAPSLRIGLTGGIGSGKSTVLNHLASHGACAIDADALAHEITAAGGAAMAAIAQQFGPEFLTPEGALDRLRMRERVFGDTAARQRLESITHPLIAQEAAARAQAAAAQGQRVVVFDIPLLVESGRWRSQLDRVVVVDCEPATQVARVVARSHLAPAEVEAIMAAQAPRLLRLAAADTVIYNDGLSLLALAAQVAALARRFGL